MNSSTILAILLILFAIDNLLTYIRLRKDEAEVKSLSKTVNACFRGATFPVPATDLDTTVRTACREGHGVYASPDGKTIAIDPAFSMKGDLSGYANQDGVFSGATEHAPIGKIIGTSSTASLQSKVGLAVSFLVGAFFCGLIMLLIGLAQ